MSGEWCDTRRLVLTSLAISLLSAATSLVVVVMMVHITSQEGDLATRVEELETMVGREEKVPSVCLLSPDPGPCTSSVRRFYYLARLGDCIEFPWGGCQGNDNNFLSLVQCRQTCGVSSPSSSSSSSPLTSTVAPPARSRPAPDCLLAPDSGPCTDRLQRFYFDHQSRQCLRWEGGSLLLISQDLLSASTTAGVPGTVTTTSLCRTV